MSNCIKVRSHETNNWCLIRVAEIDRIVQQGPEESGISTIYFHPPKLPLKVHDTVTNLQRNIGESV